MVSDIHCTKHVANVSQVAVGQGEVSQLLQAADCDHVFFVFHHCVDGVFHLADVLSEVGIFVAGHDAPGAGIVAVNTGTDVLDHQIQWILTGIFLHIQVRDFFQHHQGLNKGLVIADSGNFQCGNSHVSGVCTLGTLGVSIPTVIAVGGTLCRNGDNIMTKGFNGFAAGKGLATDGAVSTGGHTGLLAECGLFQALRHSMALSRNHFLSNQCFTAGAAVAAFGQTGILTVGSNCFVHHCGVAQSRNYFLSNQGFTAGAAVATFGQTGFGTGGCHSCTGHCVVSQSFLQNFTADGTYLIFSAGSSCSRRVPQCRNYFLSN